MLVWVVNLPSKVRITRINIFYDGHDTSEDRNQFINEMEFIITLSLWTMLMTVGIAINMFNFPPNPMRTFKMM